MNSIQAFAFALVTAAVGMMTMATPAEARRSKREGFNFGTTVRILDTNERTLAGVGSDKNTKVDSSSQAVNPYIGYGFGALNLGLTVSAEQKSTRSEEHSEDGSETTVRSSELNGKGASLFARFNFGGAFFFEGGFGLYQEKLEVSTETKRANGGLPGEFTGELDEYRVEGTGPGYHLAGGLELPMGGGFYFTSAYQVRMVQLREHGGGADLGRKRSQTQKREVLFGIAHYTK